MRTLLDFYQQSKEGASRLLLVAGSAGVGKTTTVMGMYQLIADQGLHFAQGKYDWRTRTPYTGLIQACQSLISQRGQSLRSHVSALDKEAVQVIAEALPDLELIIGQQSSPPDIGPIETGNRFRWAFREFIQSFCIPDCPLVMFLDDLHWADQESLVVLSSLLHDSDNMLIIGAYREIEGQQNQPLQKTLGLADMQIKIGPLRSNIIKQFFCDDPPENILRQSKGIPLKIEILRKIQAKGFGLEIGAKRFIVLLFDDLPDETKTVLQTAACLGAEFTVEVLAAACNTSCDAIADQLQPAIAEGLIYVRTDRSYRYWHDLIRSYIYSTIATQAAKHAQIGAALVARGNTMPTDLYIAVNQLNLGLSVVADRDSLARLNFSAARQAQQTAAFNLALTYLETALDLSTNAWEYDPDWATKLHLAASEVAYATGDFARSLTLAQAVLDASCTTTAESQAYELIIQAYTMQNHMQEAVDTALLALQNSGLSLLQEPPSLTVGDLADLPKTEDPRCLDALRILRASCTSAYVTDPALFVQIIFTMVNICKTYGNSPLAAYAYSLYGLLCCGPLDDIPTGYSIGQLSLALLNDLIADEVAAKTVDIFNGHIRPWSEHLQECQTPLLQGIKTGLKTGDIEYAGFSSINYCANALALGENLSICKVSHEEQVRLLRGLNLEYHGLYTRVGQWMIEHLSGNKADESSIISQMLQSQHGPGLTYVYTAKAIIAYLDASLSDAIAFADRAEQYVQTAAGLPLTAIHNYYQSLSLIAHYPQASESDRPSLLEKVETNQERMRTWANHCPANFAHKYELVEAEKARVLGEEGAIAHYEAAINGARANNYIQEEALALECFGNYWTPHDLDRALECLENACTAYEAWGARTKVDQLRDRIEQLRLTGQLLNRFKEACELPDGSKVYRERSDDNQTVVVIQAPDMPATRKVLANMRAIAFVARSMGLGDQCAIESPYKGKILRLPVKRIDFFIRKRGIMNNRTQTDIEVLRLFDGPESCGGVDHETGKLVWASLEIWTTAGKSFAEMIGSNINDELWTPLELHDLNQQLQQEGKLIDHPYWAYNWQQENGLWIRKRHRFMAREMFFGHIAGRLTRFSLGVEIVR